MYIRVEPGLNEQVNMTRYQFICVTITFYSISNTYKDAYHCG